MWGGCLLIITHAPMEQRNYNSAVFMSKQISVSQGASGVTFLLRYQKRRYPHWSRFLGTNATKPLLVLQGSKLPLTDSTACKALFVVSFLVKFCWLMEFHDLVTISNIMYMYRCDCKVITVVWQPIARHPHKSMAKLRVHGSWYAWLLHTSRYQNQYLTVSHCW